MFTIESYCGICIVTIISGFDAILHTCITL